MWRCGLLASGEVICGKLVYTAEDFTRHLARKHGLDKGTAEAINYVKSMHLGKEGQHSFWCGFCHMLLAGDDAGGGADWGLEQSVVDGPLSRVYSPVWKMRLSHIRDHFEKDGLHINDWICLKHKKTKGSILLEKGR